MFWFQQRFSLSAPIRPVAVRSRRSFRPEMGRLETRELLSSVPPARPLLYDGPPVPPKKPPIVAIKTASSRVDGPPLQPPIATPAAHYPPDPCLQEAGRTGNAGVEIHHEGLY